MFKVCAIMAIYNEEDILDESISALLDGGVDVYIIDNGSTDNSVDIINKYIGGGVIGFESVKHKEFGKEVYNWTKILKRKEEISLDLDYDWFIHVDADEVRCSPWTNKNLAAGIEFVDSLGYNLINFKLFNFRLSRESENFESIQNRMRSYSNVEKFNSMQVKAWKKSRYVNIVTHGGHLALVPSPKIFPVRFLLKHYPIRSAAQAIKKINNERKNRFSLEDKSKGWHVQYDSMPLDDFQLMDKIYFDDQDLKPFDISEECSVVNYESNLIIFLLDKYKKYLHLDVNVNFLREFIADTRNLYLDEIGDIFSYHKKLISEIEIKGFLDGDYLEMPSDLKFIMTDLLIFEMLSQYMRGNPFIFDAVDKNFILECIKCQQWK